MQSILSALLVKLSLKKNRYFLRFYDYSLLPRESFYTLIIIKGISA